MTLPAFTVAHADFSATCGAPVKPKGYRFAEVINAMGGLISVRPTSIHRPVQVDASWRVVRLGVVLTHLHLSVRAIHQVVELVPVSREDDVRRLDRYEIIFAVL
ncbi:MAG: hypothetical protein QOI21_38 [Actinomycetota bacterium]|nr:hypothetical protein [Actinomycetota bacterium]